MACDDQRGRGEGGETGDRGGGAAEDALERAGPRASVAEDLDCAVARQPLGHHPDAPVERGEGDRTEEVDQEGCREPCRDRRPGVGP